MPRQRRNINRLNAALDGGNVPAEPTDYSAMSTEALRLMLGERHLQQTGNRHELISRLQQNAHLVFFHTNIIASLKSTYIT